MTETEYDRILHIARDAHGGQTRDDGVTPYISHPVAVANTLQGRSECSVQAALLHDVVEDTRITLDALVRFSVDPRTIWIVDIVTRRRGEDYFVYIDRIIKSRSYDAMHLKIADVLHNRMTNKKPSRVSRYEKTLKLLRDAIRSELI